MKKSLYRAQGDTYLVEQLRYDYIDTFSYKVGLLDTAATPKMYKDDDFDADCELLDENGKDIFDFDGDND